MTQTGELLGEGPQACPFIALELDRDRRSDKPDYRHRCFAEPTPQPRAIAHQEQYCLTADFAACPIFQGWAMRASARPVPAPAGSEGGARSSQAQLPLPMPPPRASTQPALPADVAPVVPPPGETWPSDAFAVPQEPDAPSQIAAFEVASATVPAASPAFADSDPALAPGPSTLEPEPPSAWSSSNPSAPNSDEPPVPDFLAGRSERPVTQGPRASKIDAPYREQISREDLVPSWDLTDRYGADVSEHRAGRDAGRGGEGGGGRFGGLITAIAVIAILALGVLGVIFLPGLLAGHGAAPTPTPTLVAVVPTGSVALSLPPLATGTPLVSAEPTPDVTTSPEPTATPRVYRIKPGDTLGKIASRFGVSVADIQAANPQITNPDNIFVGELIVIPQRSPTETPSASP